MNASSKEMHEGRAYARSNGSTPMIVAQVIEAVCEVHVGRRAFAPDQRCECLKGNSLPAQSRLNQNQNPAALRGKIQEVRTRNQPALAFGRGGLFVCMKESKTYV